MARAAGYTRGVMARFADRLCEAIAKRGAPCAVGLDPVLEYVPDAFLRECGLSRAGDLEERARILEAYSLMTLEAVHDLVPVVKPQMAYFELYGSHGMRALERCIETARAMGLLVLLDGKRGDIGSTSRAYAEAYLASTPARPWEADALTLNPYLGEDSLAPFVEVALANDKGLFVCVRTSNPGADLTQLHEDRERRALYEVVADMVSSFNAQQVGRHGFGSVGAVVGATQPDAARRLRARMPSALFLVPGYGAQGGSLEAVRACFDARGMGALVNSARAVMYPGRFGTSHEGAAKDAIRGAARDFVGAIRNAL
ncbi:MAG TPA: orotidine-5'-phosphate decarboxylase, partial [Polyangiaceae bacterium]|nr:orotidine-5'-phosphate decarboxylase [Polyangiaceae bacterium]